MGDTEIFGKTVTSTTKAMMLYVFNAVALAVGGALMSLDQAEWDAWWWAKRLGWFCLLAGNVTNTIKAFYSNSSTAK